MIYLSNGEKEYAPSLPRTVISMSCRYGDAERSSSPIQVVAPGSGEQR